MSRQPFARRYWSTLTGDTMARGISAAARDQAGHTFGQRYWASLTMTYFSVRTQDGARASGTRAQEPADRQHHALEVSQPSADRLDLLDNGLRLKRALPASRERFRMLAPLAAALAVIGLVLGLGLASSHHLTTTARLIPSGLERNPGGAGITGIAFSPDGRTLATGDFRGGVKVWSVTADKLTLIASASSGGAVKTVAFSPDGRTLATGDSRGGVKVWSVTADKLTLIASASSGLAVNSVAFSPNGETLAVGDDNSTLTLLGIVGSAHPALLGPPVEADSPISSVAFSPDGKVLAVGTGGGLYALNIAGPARPRLTWTVGGSASSVNSVAFSPDGTIVADGRSDGDINLLNSATGQLVASFSTGASVVRVAFSPDGRTLAAGNSAGIVDMLDEHGNLIASYGDDGHGISSVAFSPDGRTLAVGNSAGEIQLFTLPSAAQANLVSLASGLTWTPLIGRVEQFANKYFTSVNEHNYAHYISLFDPQAQSGNSESAFTSGYATVADSDIILTGVSESAGQVAATVTFVSHQDLSASVDASTCTRWKISLFLIPDGKSYLITVTPASYDADYSDC